MSSILFKPLLCTTTRDTTKLIDKCEGGLEASRARKEEKWAEVRSRNMAVSPLLTLKCNCYSSLESRTAVVRVTKKAVHLFRPSCVIMARNQLQGCAYECYFTVTICLVSASHNYDFKKLIITRSKLLHSQFIPFLSVRKSGGGDV